MADEILSRIICEMPPERVEKILLGLPKDRRRTSEIRGIQRMLSEQLQAKFGQLPQEIIDNAQKIESEDQLSNLAIVY